MMVDLILIPLPMPGKQNDTMELSILLIAFSSWLAAGTAAPTVAASIPVPDTDTSQPALLPSYISLSIELGSFPAYAGTFLPPFLRSD
jgi:hypothetical protein